jgi:hypothetical protein
MPDDQKPFNPVIPGAPRAGRFVPFADRHNVDPDPDDEDRASVVLGPNGQPARLPKNANCPRCGASANERISTGFGKTKEWCKRCGSRLET